MGLANLNPAKSWMVGVAAVEVKITSILRPIDITHHARFSDPIGPFLGFEIEEQVCRIAGRTVIWGPGSSPEEGRPSGLAGHCSVGTSTAWLISFGNTVQNGSAQEARPTGRAR